MKYAYITATGKTEVEVDEQFYDLLISMDHEEFNSDRKHSRRHAIALDNVDYEGEWFSDDTDLLSDLIRGWIKIATFNNFIRYNESCIV